MWFLCDYWNACPQNTSTTQSSQPHWLDIKTVHMLRQNTLNPGITETQSNRFCLSTRANYRDSSGQDVCSPDSLPFYNEIQNNMNPINITIHADAQCQCIEPLYLPFGIVYVKSTCELKTLFCGTDFFLKALNVCALLTENPTLKTESESWAIKESLAERVQRQFGDDFQHLWQVIRCAVTGRQGGDYQQHFSILLCHVCQQHWGDSCSNFTCTHPSHNTCILEHLKILSSLIRVIHKKWHSALLAYVLYCSSTVFDIDVL